MSAISDALGMRPLEDAAAAYQRSPNAATGAGAAIREAVVGSASQGIERAADLGKAMASVGAPARGAISDFVSGIATGPTTPPPQPAPAPKPTVAAAPVTGSIVAPAPQPQITPAAAAAVPVAAPAVAAPGMDAVNRSVRTIITPEAQTATAPDSQKQVLDLLNDGTWSGMMGAKTLAKRIDADRTQQNALTTGGIAQQNATTAASAASSNAAVNAAYADRASAGAQSERVDVASKTSDLQAKKEMRALEVAAAAGDDKAMAKLRNLKAAQAGKSPEEALNEKLLDTYLKSTAEFSKDPSNMGKAAPSFQDYLGSLPPQMFPNVGKYAAALPQGMKKMVGTSGGKAVYEDGSGKRFMAP